MLNYLVETKQEYTIQLINILAPLVYEGLQSIYNEVIEISPPDNILKNFQSFMQRIPKWNNEIINKETMRIINNSKSYAWLEDLIKATLKANIIVLTYNPTVKQQIKIDSKLYQNVEIKDFIHKIYIECARELWNNPYLFYHVFQPIELKRNQRDCIILIKECIKEGIRKLLPLKYILEVYLGEEMSSGEQVINFEKCITENDERNLNKLIAKDLFINETKPVEKKINIDGTKQSLNSTISSDSSNTNNTFGLNTQIIEKINELQLTDNKTSDKIVKNKEKKNILINNIDESETSEISNNSIKSNNDYPEIFGNSIKNEDMDTTDAIFKDKEKLNFFNSYLKGNK
jgi:hypothetical protein